MEFETEWLSIGKHRLRLRSTKGFPTEVMHQLASVVRLAVDSNMSARARIVEIVLRKEQSYTYPSGLRLRKTAFVHRNSRAQSQL